MSGPMLGAEKWQHVVGDAGYRCQCTGQCGKECLRIGDGRCGRQNTHAKPLHAVPRSPVTGIAAMSVPAHEMTALCDDCHRGVDNARARASRAAAGRR